MAWEPIIYTSLLIAFIVCILLYEKGFSFKNSLTMSLFAPLIGGLFVVAGIFLTTLVGALLVFGSIIYVLNRRKIKRYSGKNFKFEVYRT